MLFRSVPPSPAELAELRARYGLDQPYPAQYLAYLTELLRGNLGVTISLTPRPVTSVVAATLPTTAVLIGVGLVLQVTTAYGVAVVSMLRRNKLVSALTWWLAVAATAAPVIFTAWALRSYFTLGYGGRDWFPYRYDGTAGAYVLPLIALVAMLAGPVILLFRSELLDTLRSTFTKFAVASGHSDLRIVGVHAAKASAGPVIAYLGASLGYLMTGVVIVEAIYDIPGVGNLILDSIGRRDRAVVVGGVCSSYRYWRSSAAWPPTSWRRPSIPVYDSKATGRVETEAAWRRTGEVGDGRGRHGARRRGRLGRLL